MALAMTSPIKHPKTGVYLMRKRVPKDLLDLIGRNEVKRSLGTRDPAEAKRRLAKVLVEVEAEWEKLRATPSPVVEEVPPLVRSLSELEAHDLARACHDQYLKTFAENPSQGWWNAEVGGTLWDRPVTHDLASALAHEAEENMQSWARRRQVELFCLTEARGFATQQELCLDESGIANLARAIGAAYQSASLKLRRAIQGEYGPSLIAASSMGARIAETQKQVASEVLLSKLFDGWRKEKGPTEKTAYAWRRVVNKLCTHLGHADAARLTADDMVAWKGALVEAGLKNKTIRDGNLAPVRAILQWGVDNRLLGANAAERVSVGVKSKTSEKIRGYNEEEARKLLLATLNEENTLKRWVPWICAYTGARLAEICQLRTEDVRQEGGVWFLRLAAEAGSLKNDNSERAIPVHSALIEAGLLDFVRKVKSGPLFHDLKPDRFGNRGGNGTKVLSRWVRDQGLVDLRISPNHSWRHRFKTLGRRHGLAPDIVDAITGHGKKTVADAYGEFDLSAMQREIEKIPQLIL